MTSFKKRLVEFVTRHQTPTVLLGISLVAAGVHLPLLYGSFIAYDDWRQIYLNLIIKNLTWANFINVLSSNFAGKGAAPSFVLSMLNWHVTPNYAGFAAFNILWLVLTVLVFYRFTALFLREPVYRYFATLFFGVHSVNADTYAWMSARCHVLGGLFALVTLIMWQKYQDELSPVKRWKWYLLSVASTAMAVWNKGIYFMIPPLVLFYDFYRNRRLSLWYLLDKIPIAMVASLPLFYSPLRRDWGAMAHPAMGTTLTSTLLNDAGLLMEYFYRLLFPGPTAVVIDLYPVDGLFEVSQDASLLFMRFPPIFNIFALLSIFAGVVWLWARHRVKTPLFAFLFIGIALAPVMNIPPRWVEFAYRFELMPSFFFSVGLASAVGLLWQRARRRGRVAIATALAALLVSHAVYTVMQCDSWDTEERYWVACTENFPDALVCRNKLANVYAGSDDTLVDAVHQLKLVHDYTRLRNPKRPGNTAHRLAMMYRRLGRLDDALFYLRRSLLTEHHNQQGRKRLQDLIAAISKEIIEKKSKRNAPKPGPPVQR